MERVKRQSQGRARYEPPVTKQALKDRSITYARVAGAAQVTEQMVWMVMNGRRRSARIAGVIDRLMRNGR